MADEANRPCCKRLDNGGWCALPDGHDASWPCVGHPRREQPTDANTLFVPRQKGKS